MNTSCAARRPSLTLLFAGLLLLLGPAPTRAAVPIATLVLRGGKVVTLDDETPLATALAVRGDRILAVGDDREIARFIHDTTRVIELDGRLVLPGFIEGHGHFLGLGHSKTIVDLSQAKSWDEVVSAVKQAAETSPRGQWILGRGWHQGKWTAPPDDNVDGYPRHDALSAAVPNHPVMLTHGSGHMTLANAAAMSAAGVTAQTPDPRGGEILRDAQGAAIGVFRENAMDYVQRAYQRSQRNRTAEEINADWSRAVELATNECLQHGITTFQDAGSSMATVDAFRELAQRGQLKVRLWVMLDDSNDALAARMADYRLVGVGNHHLTVRAVKRMIDGALGTHGAWLLEPYDDLPSSRGNNVTPPAYLRRTADLCLRHDFQFCVHAIGDRANREVLDIFEAAAREQPDKKDLRWRIEHAQHLDPADIPRFKQLGVIASMQAVHCTSDAPFVVQRLGERRSKQGAYVWKSLLNSGAVVINGTDAPVERLSPIECFYSSVTRKLAGGVEFFPEQCMTREQALRSYTKDAAFAAFEENLKGTLSPGKLADVVVLSQDILTIPTDDIPGAQVLYTIVGGRVLYQRPSE